MSARPSRKRGREHDDTAGDPSPQPGKQARKNPAAAAELSAAAPSGSLAAAPTTSPPAAAQLIKQLRACIKRFLQHVETFDAELFLLRRIHYKYGRSYRSQKWYQPVDGVRRCCERVLGKDEGRLLNGRSYEYDAQGQSRGAPKGKQQKPDRTALALRKGAARDALVGLRDAYLSMWSEHGRKHRSKKNKVRKDKQGQPLSRSLEALLPASMASPPSSVPDTAAALTACKQLLALCLSVAKLAQSAQVAWTMICNHLRSPPGPQFAPLALTLAAVAANVYSASIAMLRGDDDDDVQASGYSTTKKSSNGLMGLYELLWPLCQGSGASAPAKTPEMDLSRTLKRRAPVNIEHMAASALPARLVLGEEPQSARPSQLAVQTLEQDIGAAGLASSAKLTGAALEVGADDLEDFGTPLGQDTEDLGVLL